MRSRSPVGSVMKRLVMPATPAGYICSGCKRRFTIRALDCRRATPRRLVARPGAATSGDLDGPPRQSCDQPKSEREISPAIFTAYLLFQRIERPNPRVFAPGDIHPLVRMPNALRIAVVEE